MRFTNLVETEGDRMFPRYYFISDTSFLTFILFILAVNAGVCGAKGFDSKANGGREKLLLDLGWKFHLGDAADPEKDFGYGLGNFSTFAKAGWASGPATYDFNDSAWRTVDLPHDWGVELNFVETTNSMVVTRGSKPLGRQFPETSIGWYRRSFTIPKTDEGKRLVVKFDGVFRDCMVWLNGFFVGRNFSGYSEFSFDITDYVNYGDKNVLVVRVDATQSEGWFYEGAGIYRHVWLIKYSPLHIPLYGTYVTADVAKKSAILDIRTEVFNQNYSDIRCRLVTVVLDKGGREVGRNSTAVFHLKDYEKKVFNQKVKIRNPHLWSLEDPYLYKVVQLVKSDDSLVDETETVTGIRVIRFDPDKGFFLNGKHVEIQGTCNHQDHAGVGSALPDGLQTFRIKKLKEMGCNAYRTSHNPPTSELLDVCDSLGMLVLDENRLMGSTPIETEQLKTLILRDRNHPCVVAWSIGNEEWAIESHESGARIARTLKRIQEKYDPSRLCTFAGDNGADYEGINSVVDMRGVNYIERWIPKIDAYHHDHPYQPMWGTEESSAYCTRGVYHTDSTSGYVSDYDTNNPYWGGTAERWWTTYYARPWLAGAFVWTGFDYRGEPIPYGWPDINSNFGIMDVCGFPKNNFYYYQSWWTDKNVLHIFPHWNSNGSEQDLKAKTVDVWCFSNCDSVELLLNGRSLGMKVMQRNSHLEWGVEYEPGLLEARGWRNGEVLTTREETTGKPEVVKLTPDRSVIRGDGEDVAVVTVTVLDSAGREVPTADNLIHFEIQGVGKIIGVGNGNPSSHEPDKYLDGKYQRKLFNGKCEIIVQSLRASGEIALKGYSDGLKMSTVKISATPSPLLPTVQE
jgi:beta-galactosidase